MQLLAGWASADLTPQRPVELIGQYYQRVSRAVRDPLTATVLALEQRSSGATIQAVLVSVDTLFVTRDFQDEVRAAVRSRIPGLDPSCVLLNATHIHSGPSWFAPFRWWRPAEGVMPPEEIRSFMGERIAAAIVAAWEARRPAAVSAASVFAAVGFCRRTLHADGRAVMYGDPARSDFVGLEAGGDDEVRMMFTWDEQRHLTGVVLNVACPAQVLEAEDVVSADFFGEVRRLLRQHHGPHVQLLAQVSAAGDLSPRNLPTQRCDDTNYWRADGVTAVGARLTHAVSEGLAQAAGRIEESPCLRHAVVELRLPVRRVDGREVAAAQSEVRRLIAPYPDEEAASRGLYANFVDDIARREDAQRHGPFDDKDMDFVQLENAQAVLTRAECQDRAPEYPLELHALRVGECAWVFNPFELFVDFGHALRARSPARRTFVVELAGDAAGYLPTERAVAAGGYGALVINGKVGPEAGRMLVDASVKAVATLF